MCGEERDFNVDLGHIINKIKREKQEVVVTNIPVRTVSNEDFRKEQEKMRQSFYNRDKLFNFSIEKTHKETDYADYKKGVEEYLHE
jgi:histidinol phosphatase-like enzyme